MRRSESDIGSLPPILQIEKGTAYAMFAYDIGQSVDLDEAERRMTTIKERSRIKHKRRAPAYFDYSPAPLRIGADTEPVTIGRFRTNPGVDLLLYDFGAVSVTHTIPLSGAFSDLLSLSQELYDHEPLRAESRRRVEELLAAIGAAVERPHLVDSVEDYVMYHIESSVPALNGSDFLADHAHAVAQVLRSVSQSLAEQEIQDAIGHRLSFGPDDITVIDWNAALLLGQDMEDVLAVLEFANVELLEMRLLNRYLDRALDDAYETLSKRRWTGLHLPGTVRTKLEPIAQLQVDSAILFERVTNTLKLFGDQYLARIHRLASQRFHLESWDASITRKLHTLESIYGKLAAQAAARRMEVLEWIIIVLIGLSILVSLIVGPGH